VSDDYQRLVLMAADLADALARAERAELERDHWERRTDIAQAELAAMQHRVREIARTTDFTDPALTTALLAVIQRVETAGPGWRLLSTSEDRANALQARLDAVIALCDKYDPKDIRGIYNRIPVHEVRAAATGDTK
jgi:hypothetical protein